MDLALKIQKKMPQRADIKLSACLHTLHTTHSAHSKHFANPDRSRNRDFMGALDFSPTQVSGITSMSIRTARVLHYIAPNTIEKNRLEREKKVEFEVLQQPRKGGTQDDIIFKPKEFLDQSIREGTPEPYSTDENPEDLDEENPNDPSLTF